MAKLPKSAVTIRFVFGKGLVKARQRTDDTARHIMRQVVLQYADGAYEEMRKQLQYQVKEDVRAELVHLAAIFRRHIIGAGPTVTTPSGYLNTVTKGENPPRMSIGSGLPPWAPRNAEYLRRKRNAVGHNKWFDNRGWKESQWDARYSRRVARSNSAGPQEHGLMFKEMRADVWEHIFGPVSVRFYRQRKTDEGFVASGTIGAKGKKIQIQIGSIQVRALGKITPGMLPGYTTGNIKASDKGNPGLINLISGYNEQLGYRMGTMNNGVYRPTLEPFLGFFLTRALPHAVNERLRKGNFGTLFK